MSDLIPHMQGELDRHTTGDYGQDQYRDLIECILCSYEFNKYASCPECEWEPELYDSEPPDPDYAYDHMRDEVITNGSSLQV